MNSSAEEGLKTIVKTAIVGASTPSIVAWVGTFALKLAGATVGGIVKRSILAGIQSWIGNVAAGSFFASIQSVGALGGLSAVACWPFGIAAGGAYYFGFGHLKGIIHSCYQSIQGFILWGFTKIMLYF